MTTRRGHNEGTITKRTDGRWEARISLSDGKRKSFYGKTRQEVQRKLAQARRDVEDGLPVSDDRLTFGQYLQSWFETAKPRFRQTTQRRYETQIRVHIAPALGKTVLSKLTSQHLQEFYSNKMKAGKAISTVQNMHVVVHSALNDAVRLGVVHRNVADLVQLPGRPRTKQVSLTDDQVQKFLAALEGERMKAFFILALATGMREGELLGLTWDNVDLDVGTLYVTANLVEGKDYKLVLDEPKTSRSRRRITLPAFAISALWEHRERQLQEKQALGQAWDTTYDLVFPNTIGKPMHRRHLLYRDYPRILNRASLPKMRIHDLRHVAATILLRHGVNPKIVSEMLGHANISITLDVYSHVTPDMQQGAARIMDGVLRQEKEQRG